MSVTAYYPLPGTCCLTKGKEQEAKEELRQKINRRSALALTLSLAIFFSPKLSALPSGLFREHLFNKDVFSTAFPSHP